MSTKGLDWTPLRPHPFADSDTWYFTFCCNRDHRDFHLKWLWIAIIYVALFSLWFFPLLIPSAETVEDGHWDACFARHSSSSFTSGKLVSFLISFLKVKLKRHPPPKKKKEANAKSEIDLFWRIFHSGKHAVTKCLIMKIPSITVKSMFPCRKFHHLNNNMLFFGK